MRLEKEIKLKADMSTLIPIILRSLQSTAVQRVRALIDMRVTVLFNIRNRSL